MFDRFTPAARRAVFFARHDASETGSSEIEVEHLLLGLLRSDIGLEGRFIPANKLAAIRQQIRGNFLPAKPTPASADMPLSRPCRDALENATAEAKHLKADLVGPEHLLLAIARGQSFAASVLRDQGLTKERIRADLIHAAAATIVWQNQSVPSPLQIEGLQDMTEAARRDETPPLVGRERELERVIHILSRRTKNNAVLVGEAGVGKTAIVAGLARKIAEETAPAMLVNRRVIAVDAAALTGSRQGPRTSEQLGELLSRYPDGSGTILFVRGLFNLATTGKAWAVIEAMHALEPHLAHGTIQCIATGSPAGLRETMEKAGMLARHFEVVPVAAVGEKEAVRIVSELKADFEGFHDVVFMDAAIERAVRASGLILPGRQLPDRAIDLIDEAAAAVKLRRERQRDGAREVTPDDIDAAIAGRAGMPLDAVKRVLAQPAPDEVQRIAAQLAAVVPAHTLDWLPFLASYLAKCPPDEARRLAQAIEEAKKGGATSAAG